MGPGWVTRLYRVKVGVGSGVDAGTFETIIEGKEWQGPFGSSAEDDQREKAVRDYLIVYLSSRFPGERLILIDVVPVSKRQRPAWDR